MFSFINRIFVFARCKWRFLRNLRAVGVWWVGLGGSYDVYYMVILGLRHLPITSIVTFFNCLIFAHALCEVGSRSPLEDARTKSKGRCGITFLLNA